MIFLSNKVMEQGTKTHPITKFGWKNLSGTEFVFDYQISPVRDTSNRLPEISIIEILFYVKGIGQQLERERLCHAISVDKRISRR